MPRRALCVLRTCRALFSNSAAKIIRFGGLRLLPNGSEIGKLSPGEL